jgi:hypothetical protein
MSGWVLARGPGKVVLTSGDDGDKPSQERVAFLVGTGLTDVEGTDPGGGDIVFVFDGAHRPKVTPSPELEESYDIILPEWFFIY